MKKSKEIFSMLYNFWGIIDRWCWDELVSPMGTRRMRWMPQLREGFRRLTCDEFERLYSEPRVSLRELPLEQKPWNHMTRTEMDELEKRADRAVDYIVM